MKAFIYRQYGSSDVLRCEEIDRPSVEKREVLIKVHAASLNPLDWHYMRGIPYILRLMTGLRRPKSIRLGVDVAGRVEALGSEVTEFQVGDEVFGVCKGAFAEYACAPARFLVNKPKDITFEQAASVPIAAVTALQGLRDHGQLQPEQSVLVNGAAGGVGTFAVQIARSFGARVTGVCSTRNVEMVRSIGAERVIDYTQEDFTHGQPAYDLILDTIGNHSLAEIKRVLNRNGICVMVGGPTGKWRAGLGGWLWAAVMSAFRNRKFRGFIAKMNKADLAVLSGLMESGKLTPVLDRSYPLIEVPEAITYLETGHARGKVVITVSAVQD